MVQTDTRTWKPQSSRF